MKSTTNTLTLANVYKRFGDIEAVSDVTLTVKRGEIVGFVGPNGAGKTTTISMLMGFIRPTRGKVQILGREITPETAHQVHRAIGYVAGDMVLPPALTGAQYLDFTAHQNGRDAKRYERLVHQLSPVLDRPLKTLSRGNKQKIALIAALQHKPEILILDEPTSGLDPLMQDVFLKAITREAGEGTTVLMSSHILSEVSNICSRIVFMRAGKFIVDQPIDAITKQLGKHIIITSSNILAIKRYLPENTEIISHTATELRVAVTPEQLKPFLRWLMTKEFDDLTIEERDLDDVFHELYIDPKRRKRQ
jgi:ABC-2 type transport system ATP-binding protein